MEIGVTAGAFALALAGVELAKFAVLKVTNRTNGTSKPYCALNPAQSQQLHDLHSWHDERDEDGRMMWFTPRSIMKEQTSLLRQILEELRKR